MINSFEKIFLALLCVNFAALANSKPNVILIVSDDQGYADVSYNPEHDDYINTPHTDALAKSGIIFHRGYTSGSVCSTTRSGLMTGRYQQRYGIYTAGEGGNGTDLSVKFIPNHLKDAGYKSMAFGKWHLGHEMKYHPLHRGFDDFYGFMGRGARDFFRLEKDYDGKFGGPIFRGLEAIDDKGYLTTRITEETVKFIEENKDQPFFAYVAYNAVHAPAQAPEEDVKPVSGSETRDILVGMLKHLDHGVGEIVKTLKKHDIYENTIIFYLSDNGGAGAMDADNTPLRGLKHDIYDGGIRVPFLMSWPAQIKAGQETQSPIISLDILPTILDAAQLPALSDIDGESILPVVKGKKDNLDRPFFWNHGDGKAGIQLNNWKLVFYKGKSELYKIDDDISETKDLIKAHPEKAAELTKIYEKWLNEMAPPNASKTIVRWEGSTDTDKKKKKNPKKGKNKKEKKS
ncbi:sulfatase-like hydrolase/transferase [Lentisphaera marina]|uniref:sulfatase-like hydrolase/transferase n=1 Tax=Lentisphaera marina TaxID=1111041 RepID=UPI002365F35F|nr:sulfatase-like hydrolase/transferase [Lentisphaera marina]MDD7986586.1 sulfatase-like hydrolase/transferase [Lentisphaera marina]